jgi:hypothetical protein
MKTFSTASFWEVSVSVPLLPNLLKGRWKWQHYSLIPGLTIFSTWLFGQQWEKMSFVEHLSELIIRNRIIKAFHGLGIGHIDAFFIHALGNGHP